MKNFRRIQGAFAAVLALSGALLAAQPAEAFEVSFGFSFSRTHYSDIDYTWTRRWGASIGYDITQLSQIEFSFQDVFDRTKIGNEDRSQHDNVYSFSWVQSLAPKTYFVQPYVKLGVGQLNREASGQYWYGSSPPAVVDSLTGIVGAGLRIYLTKNLALRFEATSYLTGAKLSTWKDDFATSFGASGVF